jgi:hypothetical protein
MRDGNHNGERGDFASDTHPPGFGIVRTLLVAGAGLLTTFLVGTAASLVCVLR